MSAAREGVRMERSPGRPAAQGLYDPSHEHDACGVGFVAQIDDARAFGARLIRVQQNGLRLP